MTYDEWRESYHPSPLMNEAMARAAWDAATSAEREACADILDRNADRCDPYSIAFDVLDSNAKAIRARGQV